MEDLVKRCTVEERYHEILRTCFARTFGPPPYRLGKSKSGQRRSDQYGTQTQDIRAHEAYTKALTKGPCLFLGFALCVTPRVCRQPRNIQALLEVPSIQLQLDDVTRATFRSWAEYDHYSTANSFTKFIEDVGTLICCFIHDCPLLIDSSPSIHQCPTEANPRSRVRRLRAGSCPRLHTTRTQGQGTASCQYHVDVRKGVGENEILHIHMDANG